MQSDSDIYKDGGYLEHNPTWHEEDAPWKASQITRIIRSNNISPTSICEIGCGSGEILKCLEKQFDSNVMFTGYDISPQAYEICKTKESQNIKFHLADLLLEDVPAFDLVMAIDVFEHVEDCFGFLRKLRTKGEYKIFHIPLELSVQSVLRCTPIMKHRKTVGHIQYFMKETALATLTDTGYEVIDYFYTSGSLELSNRGWKANLLKLPRRGFYSIHKDLAVRILGGFSLMVLAK